MCCVEQPQFVRVPTRFAIEFGLEQQIGRQMEMVGIARTQAAGAAFNAFETLLQIASASFLPTQQYLSDQLPFRRSVLARQREQLGGKRSDMPFLSPKSAETADEMQCDTQRIEMTQPLCLFYGALARLGGLIGITQVLQDKGKCSQTGQARINATKSDSEPLVIIPIV